MKFSILFITFVIFSIIHAIDARRREVWFPYRIGGGHASCRNVLEMTEEAFCKKLCGSDFKWRDSKCMDHYCYCGPQRFYRFIK
nr:putative KTx Tcis26 [Tityus cisandinus]